jgi:putative membrane protein
MNLRTYRTLQALILVGLGVFFLVRIGDGRILLYINQRFLVLVLFGALGLLGVAQAALRARPPARAVEEDPGEAGDHAHHAYDGRHDHDHAHDTAGRSGLNLWLLTLPLLIGLLLPARPLGSAAAATRGVSTDSTLNIGSSTTTEVVGLPSTQRTVLDWIRALREASDPASISGEQADVTGFVYHDIRLDEGQFMVARFSLTCCVADAVAVGLVVDWPESADLPDNQWVRVHGTMSVSQLDGKVAPLIHAESVEQVLAPEQPYLFP